MMHKLLLTFVLLSLSLIGCGGGGGGSRKSARQGIRLLHSAIDLYPLDAASSKKEGEILLTAGFALESLYAALPEGPQTVSVAQSQVGGLLLSVPVEVAKNQRQTLLIYGSRLGRSAAIRSTLINDDPGEIPAGQAFVRLLHGVNGTSRVSATIGAAAAIGAVEFGGGSAYAAVPPGAHTVIIKNTSGGVLLSELKAFEADHAYSLLAAGEAGYLVLAPQYEDR